MGLGTIAYEDLIIPLTGICILIPVVLSALFEVRKDFSRKIYIIMLVLCAGICLMEIFQWCFEEGGMRETVFWDQLVYFVFYLMLVGLCYCWTLYSFFWFHGQVPKGLARLGLTVGFAAEALLLVSNLFTGSVYRIDGPELYERGPLFLYFIAFSYLYMILAIIVTASFALKRDWKKRSQDLRLFLLFFIFPIFGPVVQYVFPEISLMGVSEAVALLTVYIEVQQRTMAQYAVEKARYQDENQKYEKSLEELLAATPDALCIFHLNLSRNRRSDEFGKTTYAEGLLRGTTADDLFHNIAELAVSEEEKQRFAQIFRCSHLLHCFELGQNHISYEYRRRVTSGETHLVKTYLSMLKNPDDGEIEAILHSVDIDRQEKEEKVISAVTEREYEFIALLSVSSRKIHYQYTSAKVLSGMELRQEEYDVVMQEALVHSGHFENGSACFEQIRFDRILEMLKQQEEYSVVLPYRAEQGKILQKKLAYRYLDERREEILYFRSDITEEIRQESGRAETLRIALHEAQHANAMKTEFLSNVSHDMRTPLNAILGYVSLARGSGNAAEIADYLEKTDRAGKTLLSLINDTLDLSKIETGAITLKKEAISCGEVIRKVIASVKPSIDEKQIHFVIDNSRAVMATINVDALRLQEIFINLLSNAVKFTPVKGEIVLTVECVQLEEHCVHDRISIRDNGCGMSQEFLKKAYEPFTQERQAETANVGGSGLGLSIVKKLVDLMGGTIEVHSELGRGTEFIVCLDFERLPDDSADDPTVAQIWANLKGRHVLLVEDNVMNMEIAKKVLEARGMIISKAENGQIACDLFANSGLHAFDLILMDIRMPVMNGQQATRVIRKMDREDAAAIPIIAMSADAFDDDIRASLNAGMNAHIAKPIDPPRLYETISKYLG